MKVIQLDIAPEEIGHNKATEVALGTALWDPELHR